jgi:hypothetical protein
VVSFGILDIVLVLLFIFALYAATRGRGIWLPALILSGIIVILIERLAPGTLAGVGSAIHGIDRVNDAGPHLNIAPIITFR